MELHRAIECVAVVAIAAAAVWMVVRTTRDRRAAHLLNMEWNRRNMEAERETREDSRREERRRRVAHRHLVRRWKREEEREAERDRERRENKERGVE